MAGKIFFICGTDTSVGKTHFSASLVNFLLDKKGDFGENGLKVSYCKPFQAGANGEFSNDFCENDSAQKNEELTDAQVILHNTKLKKEQVVVSYQLKKPASPHLAARLEQVKIDFSRVFDQITALANHNDVVLVEGSGGLYVPLHLEKKEGKIVFFLDFLGNFFSEYSEKYAIFCLLVAKGGLGTLNHTALSLNALDEKKLPILSIHLNQFFSDGDKMINEDNKETIDFLAKQFQSRTFYYDYVKKNELGENKGSFLGMEFEIFLKNHLLQ